MGDYPRLMTFLSGVPWLYHPAPRKSLVQLFHALHKSVDSTFALPMVTAG